MNDVSTRLEIDESLQALVQHGLMKFVGNENGEDQYKLTEKGRKYVRAMPNKAKMRQVLEDDETAKDALDEFFNGFK